jgi:heptosyltransferase-1
LSGTNSTGPAQQSILVVRLGALGDVIHALPAVATLKHNLPDARITWAIEPRWAVLLRDNPHVDRVLALDLRGWRSSWWTARAWSELFAARRELQSARFDLAIDFQGLLKSALVARVARAREILGFDSSLLRERVAGLFYSRAVSPLAAHVVDQNLDLAAAAGATERRIEFPLPEYLPEGETPSGDFVLANPFAGWKAKQWPAARYAELARLLAARHGWPLVINCAPADRAEAEAIAPDLCAVNVSGLEGLVGISRRARAVVGVDSGPLHVAAALGKPGVALFGPTDPARNGPYGSTFTVLRSPAAVTSYRRSSAVATSMEAIRPEQVLEAVELQLSKLPLLEPHR